MDIVFLLGGDIHTVRSMVPQFVKPLVKSDKSDAADAEAICEFLLVAAQKV
uniref:Transposase n=1 Tax=Candidatus Kentrum eta TaxID=2126337 RepID=A0A450VJM7_9GAMM|nr:MAG: hypothetical protein BECKH772A_GA0070896_102322 [Candidatus Kentron sp. H]VFK01606.1 MAG: hypothetical protein BECKH772B_GA0070898_102392 [Candidatus Kentron sp. H]VFK05002.1 MAG: hypothetical protein BECKH772C_GA0070978_102284 [Candidatus Kentron sp. H]